MSNHYGFTGLAQMYHRAIIKNELAYWEQGYSLHHAQTKNSGYSFGPIQWDVANNPDAPKILRDILKNSVYDTGPNVGQRIVSDAQITKWLGDPNVPGSERKWRNENGDRFIFPER